MNSPVNVGKSHKLSLKESQAWIDDLSPSDRQRLTGADPQIVADFLQAGGDPDVRVFGGPQLLTVLSTNLADVRALKLALDAGANPSACSGSGETALHAAAGCGNLAAVELLVERGAEVRFPGSRAPLFEAAVAGHAPVVKYLLSHGAHLFDRDAQGRTLMTRLLQWGRHPELISHLWDMGANYHDGHNLWAMAVKAAHPELAISLMRERGMSLLEPVMGKTLVEHFGQSKTATAVIQTEIAKEASGVLERAFGINETRVSDIVYAPSLRVPAPKSSSMGLGI